MRFVGAGLLWVILASPASSPPFASPFLIPAMGSDDIDATLNAVCAGSEPYDNIRCDFAQVLVERPDSQCLLRLTSFTFQFKRAEPGVWKWEGVTEPQGICQVVTFYSLEGDPKDRLHWKYRQKVVSSASGQGCGLVMADSVRTFSTRIGRDLDCKGVRIGP